MSASQAATAQQPWIAPADAPFKLVSAGSQFIDNVFRCRSLVRRDGTRLPLDVYIPPAQGDLLYSLVHYLQPNRTLEVGLANGVSAMYIAQSLHDNGKGKHLAIDPFQQSDWDDVGLLTLHRAGLEQWVSLDPRPSHWALPDIEEVGERIQFAFVDGSHLFDYVMADFMAIDRILDIGGMIAFDDSDWPAITGVIRFAIANRDYEVFPTGVVIEPSPGRPRLVARGLRLLAQRFGSLRRILRNDFTIPSSQLGIQGRCVVLRKRSNDQRDSQRRQLDDF